jgi:hypothetical protein
MQEYQLSQTQEYQLSQPTADRVDELNSRLYDRNIPSGPMEAVFGVRPLSTKYALLPIVDRRPKPQEPIRQVPTYNTSQTFLPGDGHGPWSGFATKINDESRLRNQFYALQKAGQAFFVPSSQSDLYQVNIPTTSRDEMQPHPYLFEETILTAFDPNPSPSTVGNLIFQNSTRQQVMDMQG